MNASQRDAQRYRIPFEIRPDVSPSKLVDAGLMAEGLERLNTVIDVRSTCVGHPQGAHITTRLRVPFSRSGPFPDWLAVARAASDDLVAAVIERHPPVHALRLTLRGDAPDLSSGGARFGSTTRSSVSRRPCSATFGTRARSRTTPWS